MAADVGGTSVTLRVDSPVVSERKKKKEKEKTYKCKLFLPLLETTNLAFRLYTLRKNNCMSSDDKISMQKHIIFLHFKVITLCHHFPKRPKGLKSNSGKVLEK